MRLRFFFGGALFSEFLLCSPSHKGVGACVLYTWAAHNFSRSRMDICSDQRKLCVWEICAVRSGHKTRRVTVLASPCFLIYYIYTYNSICTHKGIRFFPFIPFYTVRREMRAQREREKKKTREKEPSIEVHTKAIPQFEQLFLDGKNHIHGANRMKICILFERRAAAASNIHIVFSTRPSSGSFT